jgi:uncharacterized protein YndB with AHSA1/START domain
MLIADITGYTAFLHESELEHAQSSLRDLLNLLIKETKSPLEISRLEGDAVISYALYGSVQQGQTFIEINETSYVKFRQALELMILNTNCTCRACRNLPNLDLKFFVHFGTFGLEPMANYIELIGNDVNVTHRLTKNSITETTGIKAYVLYTKEAAEALGIEPMTALMVAHKESYDHIGEVEMFVQDMHPVWEARRNEVRRVVKPEEAEAEASLLYPVPVVAMWDYITKPEYRALLSGADRATVENRKSGRIGVGSSYQCAHGDTIRPQTIVDWQPFEQFTYHGEPRGDALSLMTVAIRPHGEGTELTLRVGKPSGGSWLARLITRAIMKLTFRYRQPALLANLLERIEREREAEDE